MCLGEDIAEEDLTRKIDLHALYPFINFCTTASELKKPGPGFPSSSIQHSRGGPGSGPTLDRVLGVEDVARVLG